MLRAIATTGRKQQATSTTLAMDAARRLNIPFVERNDLRIDELMQLYNVNDIIVAKHETLRLLTGNNEIFFHPSTAHLRIKNLRAGLGDRLVDAMDLKSGMKVLDCTLGLGSDAIVESYVSQCEVVAVEINPLLSFVVAHGLATFDHESTLTIEAMRRIRVINADYVDVLRAAADDSFDVVYFDPMFRHPLEKSVSINVMRDAADHRPIPIDAIAEAKRVARCRVVMKENARSLEFARLGFNDFVGGRYSPIKYGVISCNNY